MIFSRGKNRRYDLRKLHHVTLCTPRTSFRINPDSAGTIIVSPAAGGTFFFSLPTEVLLDGNADGARSFPLRPRKRRRKGVPCVHAWADLSRHCQLLGRTRRDCCVRNAAGLRYIYRESHSDPHAQLDSPRHGGQDAAVRDFARDELRAGRARRDTAGYEGNAGFHKWNDKSPIFVLLCSSFFFC